MTLTVSPSVPVNESVENSKTASVDQRDKGVNTYNVDTDSTYALCTGSGDFCTHTTTVKSNSNLQGPVW